MADLLLCRPIVGVFIPRKHAMALSRQEPDYDHIKYAAAAAASGVPLYFLSSEDIDLEQRTIQGWVLSVENGWALRDMPWPDYVYNLAKGNAGKEEKAKVVKADSRLSWLNEVRSHRKWHTHKLLRDQFSYMLPETVLGKSWLDLQSMLERHPAVLTKPDKGTWGSGISKIWRSSDNLFCLSTSSDEEWSGFSLEQAFTRASEFARGRRLVIQQALKLLPIGQCLSDLRLMMGKDKKNQWQVLQWYIRTGRPGSFVTNWHQGGNYVDVIPGLLSAGVQPEVATDLFAQAKRVAVRVAIALEKRHAGNMVELGLDFAFDIDLRLWLLEANGWPDKGHVEHDPDVIPRVYSCVIDYAIFLWGAANNE